MNRIAIFICLGLLAAYALGKPSHTEPEMFLEYTGSETLCETEMANLDKYALQLQNNPNCAAYVLVYGGRHGTARHEMRQRRARIRRYLVKNRRVETERVHIVDGGFKEKLTVELWLIAPRANFPKPTNTVPLSEVKYRSTKQQFTCSSLY